MENKKKHINIPRRANAATVENFKENVLSFFLAEPQVRTHGHHHINPLKILKLKEIKGNNKKEMKNEGNKEEKQQKGKKKKRKEGMKRTFHH